MYPARYLVLCLASLPENGIRNLACCAEYTVMNERNIASCDQARRGSLMAGFRAPS